LDVGDDDAAQGGEGGSNNEEFFHAAGMVINLNWSWQRIFRDSVIFTVQS
jgi:hypothetical protein